jgi:hypothetical protein
MTFSGVTLAAIGRWFPRNHSVSMLLVFGARQCCFAATAISYPTAAAPPMISASSLVIWAWRARL